MEKEMHQLRLWTYWKNMHERGETGMEFRNLQRQYSILKKDIDEAISKVLQSGKFISGQPVEALEEKLADYTGRKHCITCGNGTDALELSLRAMKIGLGDAVFVPDFTFFSSGEVVSTVGAMPVFVDVEADTYNISPECLENAILKVISQGKYKPRAVIAVDLFGQLADYEKISEIAAKYGLYVIEDGAQGFGGSIKEKRACGFGDISTTSFFPAKPLGCYGDGGAVFTDCGEWNEQIRSLCVHGKSSKGKYDNIQIGMNSRLDTIQAAILSVKFEAFQKNELALINEIAQKYSEALADVVKIPFVREGYESSWAQYTIQLESREERNAVQSALRQEGIPSMAYYKKPMHEQEAFANNGCIQGEIINTNKLCETVLSLPISPYMTNEECNQVIHGIKKALGEYRK